MSSHDEIRVEDMGTGFGLETLELDGEDEEDEGEFEVEEVTLNSSVPGESLILRHPSVDGGDLTEGIYEGIFTLSGTVLHSLQIRQTDVLYRSRRAKKEFIEHDLTTNKDIVTTEFGPVEELTFGQVHEMMYAFASGLRRFVPDFQPETLVGIYLETCKEWMISFHGVLFAGGTAVTVYANLGWDALVQCINETELGCIVCDARNVKNMDDNLGNGACPTLKRLILVGNVTYASQCFEMTPIFTLLQDGQNNPSDPVMPDPDDLAVIMYTSGTTGDPKGVMMLQRNICSCMGGMLARMAGDLSTDTYLSYLPLAHVFELVLHNTCISCGASICLGSPRSLVAKKGGAKIVGDLEVYAPTIMVGVPRVFESITKGIKSKIRAAGGAKEWLFNSAMDRTIQGIRSTRKRTYEVMGSGILFGRIRELVGGRLRMLISGGAPLSESSQLFLQAALGPATVVVQGYGLTETCCGGCVQDVHPEGETTTLNIGTPFTCVEIKLVDLPQLGYLTDSRIPTGELCIRGPCVSQGYFKKPDMTAESWDEQGWFHTGDIAKFWPDGRVSIIDRKKNLVKLSQGEYVALEFLEMLYGESPFVFPNGVCVIANSFKSYLTALVVVDPNYAREWAVKNGVEEMSLKQLAESPQLQADVLDSFRDLHRDYKRKSFERIVALTLLWEAFSPENGLLTASSKLKRRAIQKTFKPLIDSMYQLGMSTDILTDVDAGMRVPKYFYQVSPDYMISGM